MDSFLVFNIFLAILASFSWGLTAFLIKTGMRNQDPLFALFIRGITASPILIIISLILGNDLSIYFQGDTFLLVFISSIIVIAGDGLFMYSLKRYKVTLIQPIVSIYPLVTTILLIITKIEVIGLLVIIGTPLIIIGVAIVSASNEGGTGKTFELEALLLALSVAGLWGSAIFFVRKILLVEGTEAFGLTGIRVVQIALGALLLFLFNKKRGNVDEDVDLFNKKSIRYLIYSGITGFVIGASALFIAVKNIGAAIPTPISSTNPIVVVLLGMAIGTDPRNNRKLIGTIISVIGTIVIVLPS